MLQLPTTTTSITAKSSDYDQALPKFSLGEMIRWNIDRLCNTAFILNEVCQLRLVSRYFRAVAAAYFFTQETGVRIQCTYSRYISKTYMSKCISIDSYLKN